MICKKKKKIISSLFLNLLLSTARLLTKILHRHDNNILNYCYLLETELPTMSVHTYCCLLLIAELFSTADSRVTYNECTHLLLSILLIAELLSAANSRVTYNECTHLLLSTADSRVAFYC